MLSDGDFDWVGTFAVSRDVYRGHNFSLELSILGTQFVEKVEKEEQL